MRTRPAVLSLLVLALAASPLGAQAPATVRVLRLATGKVEVVDLDRYVAAVLPAEMGGHAPLAALEAQAVAARSYALARVGRHAAEGADLCDGTHCQVYPGAGSSTAESRRAVEQTHGLVLLQAGRVIAAPFHAACGGHTARPQDVWDDEEQPLIEGVPDDACAFSAGARWSFDLPRAALSTLGAALGLPGARFLEVFGRGPDGRVASVRLVAPGGRSVVVRGYAFREAAARLWGPRAVRSTQFELAERPGDYVLAGRGSGHGAGLCQEGAIARARHGAAFRDILAIYYRGARVGSLADAGTR